MLHGVIWYLVTGVSEHPRWDKYVATKLWQPSTTITLSNIPKLRRSQLSRSGSVKSHTTPCRLVDKVIRIVLSSSAVKLKEVLLPFVVIYASSRPLLIVWRDWNVGGYGALVEWYWQGLNRCTQRQTFPNTTLSTNPISVFLESHGGLPQRAVETPYDMTLLHFPSRCKRRLLPQRRCKLNQSVTSPQKSLISFELASYRKFSV